eukprot:9738768-Alexandrium_andersonii.AAC.1
MSASLVGSEMCIRDSACAGLPLSSRTLASVSSSPRQSWESISRPPKAVSYTHLTLPTICSV